MGGSEQTTTFDEYKCLRCRQLSYTNTLKICGGEKRMYEEEEEWDEEGEEEWEEEEW